MLAHKGQIGMTGVEFDTRERMRGFSHIPVYIDDDDMPRYLPRTFLEVLD